MAWLHSEAHFRLMLQLGQDLSLELTVWVLPDRIYVVLASDDLTYWSPIATNILQTAVFRFTEPLAEWQRFYHLEADGITFEDLMLLGSPRTDGVHFLG